jgi:dihydroorotate dehydrogenase (fumarate)
MAGANAVQVVSLVLREGTSVLPGLIAELGSWLEEHEYDSLRQACGSMNMLRCPDPTPYQRGNYLRILRSFKRFAVR